MKNNVINHEINIISLALLYPWLCCIIFYNKYSGENINQFSFTKGKLVKRYKLPPNLISQPKAEGLMTMW